MVQPRLIAKNYLRSWFAIDVAACLPVTYIVLLAGGGEGSQGGAQQLKALKIVRLLRLAKMLRLARLKRLLKRLDEDLPGIWTCSQLMSLVIIILYISHAFACFWYYVGASNQLLPPPVGYAPCPAAGQAACFDPDSDCPTIRKCCQCPSV